MKVTNSYILKNCFNILNPQMPFKVTAVSLKRCYFAVCRCPMEDLGMVYVSLPHSCPLPLEWKLLPQGMEREGMLQAQTKQRLVTSASRNRGPQEDQRPQEELPGDGQTSHIHLVLEHKAQTELRHCLKIRGPAAMSHRDALLLLRSLTPSQK